MRWSDVFNRSSLGSNVFFCPYWLDIFGPPASPFQGTGIPARCTGSLFGPTLRNAAFLDGGLVHRDPPYFSGLRGGWVIGFATLRHLCALKGLQQPRKLNGEHFVPTDEQLRRRLDRQLNDDRAGLMKRLRRFEHVGDGDEITKVALELDALRSWAERLDRMVQYLADANGRHIDAVGMASDLGYSDRSVERYVDRLRRLGYADPHDLSLTPIGRQHDTFLGVAPLALTVKTALARDPVVAAAATSDPGGSTMVE